MSYLWHRDDLESLGYSLLDMWLGDLPWFLTDSSSSDKGWTPDVLKNMVKKREERWNVNIKVKYIYFIYVCIKFVDQNNVIPEFLVEWIDKCRKLDQKEVPDYDYFYKLIKDYGEKMNNKSNNFKKRKQCDEIHNRSDKENELKSIDLCDEDNKRIKMTSEE